SYSAYPLLLPSFPTRRSSDLPSMAAWSRSVSLTGPSLFPVGNTTASQKTAAINAGNISIPPWSRPHGGRLHQSGGGVSTSSRTRSEEHTSELQSRRDLVCRLL